MEQLELFEFPKFSIDKKIRLIELFAGMGTQAQALNRLGVEFEHHFVCEFDKYAISVYNAIHGTNFETSDITKVHAADLNITEKDKFTYLLTYSFPCFTGDTLVLTDKGYKEIKDVTVDDYVLTHDNKYKKVLASKQTGEREIFSIKGMCFDEIKCTDNHKFYTRTMYRKYPTYENGKRGSVRIFNAPEWKECKTLSKNDYLGVAINQNSIIPTWEGIDFTWNDGRKPRHKNELSKLLNNHSFWWLIGRYLGDGWCRNQGGIIICCSKSEVFEILPHLRNCNFNYSISEERTVNKIHVPLKELQKFVEQFGKGAGNKYIPSFVFDMPVNLLQSFVDGYISADGYSKDNLYKVSSVSKKLIYGIAQIVAKAYKTPYRIYFTKRKPTCVIENRICNQKDTYTLVFKTQRKKQDKVFYEDGYIWFPIYDIKNTNIIEPVYDLEVEQSHSFTANGVIAHNCQDLSLAGKQRGMKKGNNTRSGLLWEVERLLNECTELPDILLMENVPQVHSEQNKFDFDLWLAFLRKKGYVNFWKDLNAKNFGIPQNRERCFCVSFLSKGFSEYDFPKEIELSFVMKDLLEPEVDEKYYINTPKAKELIEKLVVENKISDFEPCDLTTKESCLLEKSPCLTARYDAGICKHKLERGGVIEKK